MARQASWRAFALLAALLLACVAGCHAELKVTELEHKVDATGTGTFLVVGDWYRLENAGDGAESSFVACREGRGRVTAVIGVLNRDAEDLVKQGLTGYENTAGWLPTKPWEPPAERARAGLVCRTVELPRPVKPGGKASVRVIWTVSDALEALPKQISVHEVPKFTAEDSTVPPSPYVVVKLKTHVSLPSGPESRSEAHFKKGIEGELHYEVKDEIAPWSREPFDAHFEFPSPGLVRAGRIVREISVSHWGEVQTSEWVDLVNVGPPLVGEFSRLDLGANADRPGAGAASVGVTAVVPGTAYNFYFRDEIGNVSSSSVTPYAQGDGYVAAIQLRYRFPLMGGWATRFNFGYALDLGEVVSKLSTGPQRYGVSVPLGTPIRAVEVGEMETRVVLPEGAAVVEATTVLATGMLGGVSQEADVKYTYLDTVGRPVVVLRVRDLHPDLTAVPINITYDLPPATLLREPLVLSAAVLVVGLLAIGIGRTSLSLAPKGGKAD
ncbi:unnamed protein product [Pedinophyceae sp. YPF-701]|nr:unnamed protein product [Pedinophyceae sp. YPF-701]